MSIIEEPTRPSPPGAVTPVAEPARLSRAEDPAFADRTAMTRADRISNLLAVVLPFAAVFVAIVLLWGTAVNTADIVTMIVLYVLTGAGITVGFHRLLTHRAFQSYPVIERGLAVLGSLSVEGLSSIGSPTTANITPSATRRATRTARTSVTARG